MSDLVTYSTFPESAELDLIWKLAGRLADTEFVPRDLRRKPEAVLACMLTGRELGIGPMQALRDVFIQNGRPGMMATLMADRARAAGHRVRTLEQTDGRCTVQIHRRGEQQPEPPVTWTLDDAKTAGLLGKDNWKHYPKAMLWSRAVSAAIRRDCSEVLGGIVYTPEELQSSNGQTEVVWDNPEGPEVDLETGEVIVDAPAGLAATRLAPASPAAPTIHLNAQGIPTGFVVPTHGEIDTLLNHQQARDFYDLAPPDFKDAVKAVVGVEHWKAVWHGEVGQIRSMLHAALKGLEQSAGADGGNREDRGPSVGLDSSASAGDQSGAATIPPGAAVPDPPAGASGPPHRPSQARTRAQAGAGSTLPGDSPSEETSDA